MSPVKLGVLTLSLNKKSWFEESTFFRKLTQAGKNIGVDVYIFTPENVDEEKKRIYAHIYNGSNWYRKWIAFPDLFLDRSRFHSMEKYRAASSFRKRNPQLTFINSPLSNKWIIFRELSQNPSIRSHLPSTVIYSKFEDLRKHLHDNQIVFLKPITGTGGRDILRVEKLDKDQYIISGRMQSRRIMPERRVNLVQLQSIIDEKQPVNRYIIQQGIDIRMKNGSVHDYRLLIQKNGKGKWELTGVVGRVGPAGSVTSNLHGGGRAVPMMKLLTKWFGNERKARTAAEGIREFGYKIAETLESNYGRLCELALDIAVDIKGHIWLLEVNTKPAREVFSRVGDLSSYRKAIRRPLEFAKWVHRNKPDDVS